jgi:hypothetical protein
VDDFDADTPPPRCRPIGDPVPPFVVLPPGESVLGAFKGWDDRGRIPAGSVLCDHVGTACGTVKASGYRVAAVSMDPNAPGRLALGKVGDLAPADTLDAYRVAVVIQEGKRSPAVVVMSPK